MTNYEWTKVVNIDEMTDVLVAVRQASICELCIRRECTAIGKCNKKDIRQIVKEWLNMEVGE